MLSYRPDSSELSPNILVSASQLVPNSDGSYRVPFASEASTFNAIASGALVPAVYAAFFATKTDGTSRLFLSMGDQIQEATFPTWTARTGALTNSTKWHFCQYGNQTLAASKGNAIQESSSGNFAALAGAPKALVVETLSDAVLAWNVDDGADKPDWLFISDVGNNTQWTPATSNLAYQVQLTDCPGPGTAMIRFRDFVIIFKNRGMWIAQPSFNTDLIWDIRLFSADVGCVGKDACIVAGDVLYFMDDADVYSFDGAVIRSIVTPYVKKSLLADMRAIAATGSSLEHVTATYDDICQAVSFYGGTGVKKVKAWIFNPASGEWGLQWAADSNGATPTNLVAVPFSAPSKAIKALTGSPAFTNECRPCIYSVTSGGSTTQTFQNGHGMATTGVAGSAVTAYFGSPFKTQLLSRLYMNADSNTGITVTVVARRAPRSSATQQASTSAASFSADMIADMLASGHFFKITWTFATTADFQKWLDYVAELAPGGKH